MDIEGLYILTVAVGGKGGTYPSDLQRRYDRPPGTFASRLEAYFCSVRVPWICQGALGNALLTPG